MFEEVFNNYDKIINKMDFWRGNELFYKIFSRWKNGCCELMYYKFVDLNEYIKEKIVEEKEDVILRFIIFDNVL